MKNKTVGRLINDEQLKHLLNGSKYYGTDAWDEFCDMISECDAVDAVQVKHGRWVWTRYYVWVCDQCGKSPTKGMGYVQGKDELFDFCPNCGTRMQGWTGEGGEE